MSSIEARTEAPRVLAPRPDPFALSTLIVWLETQDPKGAYDFLATKQCALCQYFRAQGYTVHGCGGDYIRISADRFERTPLPRSFRNAARHSTFGAMLQSARAAL